LIKNIIDNGHNAGIKVGMCGEMAGDILMTIILLGLGLDEFSTSPITTPEIKRIIRSVTVNQAVEMAEGAMMLSTGKEVETYVRKKFKELVPDIAMELE
jgi:phosphotransferase system enzyme I (PtsI)